MRAALLGTAQISAVLGLAQLVGRVFVSRIAFALGSRLGSNKLKDDDRSEAPINLIEQEALDFGGYDLPPKKWTVMI